MSRSGHNLHRGEGPQEGVRKDGSTARFPLHACVDACTSDGALGTSKNDAFTSLHACASTSRWLGHNAELGWARVQKLGLAPFLGCACAGTRSTSTAAQQRGNVQALGQGVTRNDQCSQLDAGSARQLGQIEGTVKRWCARGVDGSDTWRRKAELDG